MPPMGSKFSLREVRRLRVEAVLSEKWAMPENGPPRRTLRADARSNTQGYTDWMMLSAEGFAEGSAEDFEGLDAGIPLEIRWNDRPRRNFGGGFFKHVLCGFDVLVPPFPVAPVFVTDLPMFVRIGRAGFEADELFVFGDMEPEFDEHGAIIDEHLFEIIDLPIRALPGRLGAEALDTLDEHTPIPRAIVDGHVATLRQL